MKWIEILRKDNYALLQSESDTQYVVACGYNPDAPENQQWDSGRYFTYWNNANAKAKCLVNAIDYFQWNTEENYIPRRRMEELATNFKDKMVELAIDCNMSDTDFEDELEEFDLEDYEREFFGLKELEEGE